MNAYYNDSHAYDPTAGRAIGNVRRQKQLEQKRLRTMSWEDYGISKYRYRELKNFCLQYPEKKKQMKYGLSAAGYDWMPGSGKIGRPTENQAINNSAYIKDCLMIEQAAREASSVISQWILASVTEGMSYEELELHPELGKVPVCKKDFYGIRRLFYAILHKKRKL